MSDVYIDIKEAINGYTVTFSEGYVKIHREICDRRIDALQIVLNRVKQLAEEEVRLIQEGGKLQ